MSKMEKAENELDKMELLKYIIDLDNTSYEIVNEYGLKNYKAIAVKANQLIALSDKIKKIALELEDKEDE